VAGSERACRIGIKREADGLTASTNMLPTIGGHLVMTIYEPTSVPDLGHRPHAWSTS
jgi:hypothetical protein